MSTPTPSLKVIAINSFGYLMQDEAGERWYEKMLTTPEQKEALEVYLQRTGARRTWPAAERAREEPKVLSEREIEPLYREATEADDAFSRALKEEFGSDYAMHRYHEEGWSTRIYAAWERAREATMAYLDAARVRSQAAEVGRKMAEHEATRRLDAQDPAKQAEERLLRNTGLDR